jgi:hypothetical protein
MALVAYDYSDSSDIEDEESIPSGVYSIKEGEKCVLIARFLK